MELYLSSPDGSYLAVPVGQGRFALIDQCDAELVAHYHWRCRKLGGRYYVFAGSSRKGLSLHRLIMGPPEGLEVDHINRDPLDNRRANLRIVTHAQNMQNRKLNRNSSTGVRNVRHHKGRFNVRIVADHKRYCFGSYDTLEEAAAVAREARRRLLPHSSD